MKTIKDKRPVRASSDLAGDAPDGQRIEAERQALRNDFMAVFSGERGSRVLAELLRRYGWRDGVELASYRPAMAHADMCFVEGQKEVVRHILTMTGGLLPKVAPEVIASHTNHKG